MRTALRWLAQRWVAVLLTVGVLFTAMSVVVPLVFGPGGVSAPMTPEAKQAIAGLRESSVYVRSGSDAEWELDVPAARKLIGDRPLLVAGFADPAAFDPERAPYPSLIESDDKAYLARLGRSNPLKDYDTPMLRTCQAIAAEYRDSMVVVLHPRAAFSRACIGPDFPRSEYDDSDPPRWPEGVLASASTSAREDREAGRMLRLIEELVPAYERSLAQLDEAPGERDLGGPFRTLRISGFIVGGIVAAALLFLLLRRGFGTASDRADQRRERSGAQAAAQADVNALADRVLALERDQARALVGGKRPPDPERVLELAEGYLLLVRDFEGARTTDEFRTISRRAEHLLKAAPR